MSNEAKNLLSNSIVCDLALGFEPELEVMRKWDLLEEYRKNGIHFVGLALAGDSTSLEETVRYIARHRYRIEQDENLILVNSVDDIHQAKETGKLAVSFWFQGSNPIASDPNMIDIYHQLGVKYMLLTYNKRNAVGDGCAETKDAGLSDFGKQVIERMNKIGMIVDVSHGSVKMSLDAINSSTSPVIFSHSNAYGVFPHPRNLTDEQIQACAKQGGVIGINSVNMLLGSKASEPAELLKHIRYISDLVGPESISLGLDQIYFNEVLDLFFEKTSPGTYKKGYSGNLNPNDWQSMSVNRLMELVVLLQKNSFTEIEIKGILGENFLRVARQVWK